MGNKTDNKGLAPGGIPVQEEKPTPVRLGYFFPAEFARHEATWLSWPHKEESWPGKINSIFPAYCQFVKELAMGEKVRINVLDQAMKTFALTHLEKAGTDLSKLEFF